MPSQISVLFVCLGNICRSPTAEGVFRKKVADAGLTEQIFIDSAGTSAYHVGEPADQRSSQVAKEFGYDLSAIRSRKLVAEDGEKFDLIIAMDKANLNDMESLISSAYHDKLKLFLADYGSDNSTDEVPDPYYGGSQGFVNVVRLIEDASDALLAELEPQISAVKY